MPVEDNSNEQQRDDIDVSPGAHSGMQSPASLIQQPPKSQYSNPHENKALFPLPQIQ